MQFGPPAPYEAPLQQPLVQQMQHQAPVQSGHFQGFAPYGANYLPGTYAPPTALPAYAQPTMPRNWQACVDAAVVGQMTQLHQELEKMQSLIRETAM